MRSRDPKRRARLRRLLVGAGLAVGLTATALISVRAHDARQRQRWLDPTFGIAGVAQLRLGDALEPRVLALAPDGRLFLAGGQLCAGQRTSESIFVACLRPDGALDLSFGAQGKTLLDLGAAHHQPSAGALVPLSDGGLLVIADAVPEDDRARLFVLHLDALGQLDAEFGRQVLELGAPHGTIAGLAKRPDGRFVVAVQLRNAQSQEGFALAQFTAEGRRDRAFASDGLLTLEPGARQLGVKAVAVDAEGRVLLAGGTWTGELTRRDFTVLRFLSDGAADPSFGHQGAVIADFERGHDEAAALLLLPDGKVLAVGTSVRPWARGFFSRVALARFTSAGKPDPGFGVAGQALFDDGSPFDVITAARLADGRVLIGGSQLHGNPLRLFEKTDADFALARFGATGAIDPTFGAATGVWWSTVGRAQSFALQPDGRVLIAGKSADGTTAIVRVKQ